MLHAGIDLGGTSIKAGIVDTDGRILVQDSCLTLAERPADEILTDAANLCLRLCDSLGISASELGSIGFGTPGMVDQQEVRIITSANLPSFRNIAVADFFHQYSPKLKVPVYLENDANCAALAEAEAGNAKGYESSITITLGTGLGAGVILNHRILIGKTGFAPEFGHVIIEVDGEECPCGRKGCMERYVSATALIRQASDAAALKPLSLLNKPEYQGTAKGVFDAAESGDDTARAVIEKYVHYLAVSLTNIVYIYGSEIILLGGGVANAGEALLEPLREKFELYQMPASRGKTAIAQAKFKNDAGIIGAAMLHRMY